MTFAEDTERKEHKETIKQREEIYQALIESTDIGFVVLNARAAVVDANVTYVSLAGHRCIRDILGKNIFEWTAPHDRDRLAQELMICLEKGSARNLEIDHTDRKGSVTPVEINSTRINTDSGNSIVAFCRDISNRRRIAGRLNYELEKVSALTESTPFGLMVIDKRGNLKYINNKFKIIFGYEIEDLRDGRTWFRKAYPDRDYRHRVISTWVECAGSFLKPGEAGERKPYTFTAVCKDGSKKMINFIPVQLSSGDTLISCEDITARKLMEKEKMQLEARMRQSEKMEAIGKLAGGIAHDFNNILSVLLGHAGFLKMKIRGDDPLKARVAQIIDAIEKASSFTRSLLAFSRKQDVVLQPVQINAVIRKGIYVLAALLPKNIQLEMLLDAQDETILADISKIDQVMMNLIANARDAMPQGGKITIESKKVTLDKRFQELHGYGAPAEYVLITVADTGTGMDEGAKDKIFEPFYTTKKTGEGTGLGLAIVYGIVKQHNGYINVSSEPNRGTTFNVYFPVETPEKPERSMSHSSEAKVNNADADEGPPAF